MKRLRVTLDREEVATAMDACEHVMEYVHYAEFEGWGNCPEDYPKLREKLRGILADCDLRGKRVV